jgi:hypothetical protein
MCSLLLLLLLSAATVDLIAQNGFDFRLSQVAAYGNGLYFAGAWMQVCWISLTLLIGIRLRFLAFMSACCCGKVTG